MPQGPIEISARAGFHRRGRPGALNDLLRAAGELLVPAVQAALVEFAITTDRSGTFSYVNGTAKIDTYETTIVQQWVRYLASHAAFQGYGVAWESAFRSGKQGRPPTVDIVIEDDESTVERRVALIEVKVSEGQLDEYALWKDACKLWTLTVGAEDGALVDVDAACFVVNIVSGLAEGTTPAAFEAGAKALAVKWSEYTPRIVPVCSAVFPTFRPSPTGAPGETPMWVVHGLAMYELKPPRT